MVSAADDFVTDESETEKEYTFKFKVPKLNMSSMPSMPSMPNMPSVPSPSSLVPEDVQKHFLNAQRENLLAVRSFIDAVIGRIETASSEVEKKNSDRIEID